MFLFFLCQASGKRHPARRSILPLAASVSGAVPEFGSDMPTVSLRIPQIGEGLQEARLVAVLKNPGDKVKRDEPIYQMETDKAVMDVESPYEGVLSEWLAAVDTILPIGGEVARMDVPDGVQEMAAGHGPVAAEQKPVATASTSAAPTGGPARNADIPPRTRAYAKEKGVADDKLGEIRASGSKLMPADIDAYLGGTPAAVSVKPKEGSAYSDSAIVAKQRILNSRMVRGNQLVVPGTITCVLNWEPVEALRAKVKASGNAFQPSAFTMFAYAVARTLADFPAFRTAMPNDDTYRTFKQAQLGVAVSLPGDELVIAVVEDSDALNWQEFAERMRERIELARSGRDQANEAVTISLTNMQHFGLRDAVPVVVPPSMATLFIGEVYNGLANDLDGMKLRRMCNLALTFDHRIVNGVGAANFLNAIKDKAEKIESLIK